MMPRTARLVMTQEQYQVLRRNLLQPDGLERAAVALAGRRFAGRDIDLYLHSALFPADAECRQQGRVVVEPEPAWILRSFRVFADSPAPVYLHAHSHPFSATATFSGVDDAYLAGEIQSLAGYLRLRERTRAAWFLRLVWGTREDGFAGECYSADGCLIARVGELRVVGRDGIRRIYAAGHGNGASDAQALPIARLDRNIRWLGLAGQDRLRKTHLVICGVGGLGSAVVANARGLGFRRITVVDPDRVESSNLSRLFGARSRDVGRQKVAVMRRYIQEVETDADVVAVPESVGSPAGRAALLDGDLLVCGLDSVEARLEAQILAARYLKPLLDLGSGIALAPGTTQVRHMGGQAIFYIPGGPCLLCQGLDLSRVRSPEHQAVRRAVGYVDGTDETPPSAITINSVCAGIGMDLVVKYLTGFGPFPTYLRYDFLAHRTQQFTFSRQSACQICGTAGVEGFGDEEAIPLQSPVLGRLGDTPEHLEADREKERARAASSEQ